MKVSRVQRDMLEWIDQYGSADIYPWYAGTHCAPPHGNGNASIMCQPQTFQSLLRRGLIIRIDGNRYARNPVPAR